MTFNHLTLRSLLGTAVTLPMKRPLGTAHRRSTRLRFFSSIY